MQPKGFTYHQYAANQSDLEAQGRFARVTETKVVGAGAAYPALSKGSPFASDPVPQEQPLGFSVDAMQPVGEPHEIAKSKTAQASSPAATSLPQDRGGDASLTSPRPGEARGSGGVLVSRQSPPSEEERRA
jgi:hypothetical protein